MLRFWQKWLRTGEESGNRKGRDSMSRRRRGHRHYQRPRLEWLEDRIAPAVYYTPEQIQEAYGINRIQVGSSGVTGNGAGQTIALMEVDEDPNLVTDLQTFDSMYTTAGLNLSTFGSFSGPMSGSTQPWFNAVWSPTNTNTTPVNTTSSQGEIALDVEWAHAIAPMANILVVYSDASGLELDKAAAYAASVPGVSVVSISYGQTEANDDSYFVTPSNHPVAFVAAAGDSGDDNALYPNPPIDSYPGSSPDVIAVGGTTLTVNPDGSYNSETGWSYPSPEETFSPGSFTGSWTPNPGGFSGTYYTAAVGSTSTAATWSMTTSSDDLGHDNRTEVSVTWVEGAGNATDATFKIYNGTVSPAHLVATVPVNETQAPVGNLDGSTYFQELGAYAFNNGNAGGTVTVVLDASSSSGGTSVVADTIGLAPDSAGGGAISGIETKPSYQMGVTPGTQRTTPDIAFDADPSTGVRIVQTYLTTDTHTGGTSFAAPAIAGLIAIADQDRASAGLPALNSTTALTRLYALASSKPYDFHSITSGYNGYEASAGYNLVTGLGTPVANLLIPDLAGVPGPLDYIAPERRDAEQPDDDDQWGQL